ncbi:hypothetical protein, partial [Desulfoluna sp.]|uniref:hypothetical protein n=1 Tax=Desulfoluna sp. TaxID=2045199 RepID=UPI00261DF2DA
AQQSVSFTPALRLFVPARRSLAPDTPRQSLGARKSDENTKVAETMIKAQTYTKSKADVICLDESASTCFQGVFT